MLSFDDISKITYHVNQCETYNLDVRELRNRIKSNEFERLPVGARSKLKLKNDDKLEIYDLVKNPVIIKNRLDEEVLSEKALKQLILEDISSFLKELGEGFSYISNEYKIKVGDSYNYIDLLLFNIKYNCYVVVELKITELKKEHIGQIQVYMNYIDKNIKTIYQDKTIGIIIVKKDNYYVIDYCSDDRIISREYKLI